ncbi:hypothetical protein SCHPADRAFT_897579, partial [Schizopora paradoxa]
LRYNLERGEIVRVRFTDGSCIQQQLQHWREASHQSSSDTSRRLASHLNAVSVTSWRKMWSPAQISSSPPFSKLIGILWAVGNIMRLRGEHGKEERRNESFDLAEIEGPPAKLADGNLGKRQGWGGVALIGWNRVEALISTPSANFEIEPSDFAKSKIWVPFSFILGQPPSLIIYQTAGRRKKDRAAENRSHGSYNYMKKNAWKTKERRSGGE